MERIAAECPLRRQFFEDQVVSRGHVPLVFSPGWDNTDIFLFSRSITAVMQLVLMVKVYID